MEFTWIVKAKETEFGWTFLSVVLESKISARLTIRQTEGTDSRKNESFERFFDSVDSKFQRKRSIRSDRSSSTEEQRNNDVTGQRRLLGDLIGEREKLAFFKRNDRLNSQIKNAFLLSLDIQYVDQRDESNEQHLLLLHRKRTSFALFFSRCSSLSLTHRWSSNESRSALPLNWSCDSIVFFCKSFRDRLIQR